MDQVAWKRRAMGLQGGLAVSSQRKNAPISGAEWDSGSNSGLISIIH